MIRYSIYILTLISITNIFNSCSKVETVDVDKLIFAKMNESGFINYKNNSLRLAKSTGSAHSASFFITKYNTIAQKNVNASTGKPIESGSFENGSLIVKDFYDNTIDAKTFSAIMYYDKTNANADANGVVWAYLNTDGTARISTTSKGSSCTSCHSQAGHVQYGLMNKYFP
jgi:hypothetical protein